MALISGILAALYSESAEWQNFLVFPLLYCRIGIGNTQIKKNIVLFRPRLENFIGYTRRNVVYGEWNDRGRLFEAEAEKTEGITIKMEDTTCGKKR